MMLVMLTPSLVCAMPVCADASNTVKAEKPCTGHGEHRSDKNKAKQVNFMQDCTGVDFQLASSPAIEKPDVLKALFLTVFVLPTQQQSVNNVSVVRGPPLYIARLAETYPPVYLNTQRLRI